MISRPHTVPSRPTAVTAWLAGPPALRLEAGLLVALIDDLLTLLAPYPITSLDSSEPRSYRLSPRGRARLAASLQAGRIDTLVLATPAQPPAVGGQDDATVLLALSSAQGHDAPVEVQLTLRPAAAERFAPAAHDVTAFVRRWFVPLRAAAGFVSVQGVADGREYGDWPNVTAHERRRHALVRGWLATRRYLRGACWGMGLGAELCDVLGGQERVLREVPAPLVQPLGDGVWLQLSAAPPADPPALARLAAFLEPVLLWTPESLQVTAEEARTHAEAEPQPRDLERARLLAEAAAYAARIAEDLARATGRAHRAVPIHGLATADVDVALNVSLAQPPTPAQLAYVVATVQRWYADGCVGTFGGKGFHDLSGPTVDGRVMRWQADLGSADSQRALRDLARRLAALPNVTVKRLALGTQVAG